MTLSIVARLANNAIESLTTKGGFSPWAFCVAGDTFALNGILLGTRLIEAACALVLLQLGWYAWALRGDRHLVIVRQGWLFLLGALLVVSGGVGRALDELTSVTPVYRLQAIWDVWTGLVCLAVPLAMPFLVRRERELQPHDGAD